MSDNDIFRCSSHRSWKERFKRSQYLRRMFFWLYDRPDPFDETVRSDQKGHAMDSHVFAAHKRFLAPNTVGFNDFFLHVGKQREWEVEFLDEFVVRFDGIRTDPQNHGSFVVDPGVRVAEPTGFLGAPRGVVPGIEVKDDGFPLQIQE